MHKQLSNYSPVLLRLSGLFSLRPSREGCLRHMAPRFEKEAEICSHGLHRLIGIHARTTCPGLTGTLEAFAIKMEKFATYLKGIAGLCGVQEGVFKKSFQ